MKREAQFSFLLRFYKRGQLFWETIHVITREYADPTVTKTDALKIAEGEAITFAKKIKKNMVYSRYGIALDSSTFTGEWK